MQNKQTIFLDKINSIFHLQSVNLSAWALIFPPLQKSMCLKTGVFVHLRGVVRVTSYSASLLSGTILVGAVSVVLVVRLTVDVSSVEARVVFVVVAGVVVEVVVFRSM